MIGAGNVATFLATAFHSAGHRIELVYSRTLSKAAALGSLVGARHTTNEDDISVAGGIRIVALTDEATVALAGRNPFGGGLLVHTAGSIPMSIFADCSPDYGVLYPLQTFSAGRGPSGHGVPFCIEANNRSNLEQLRELASGTGNTVYEVSSESRLMLHLAAVFACNFTNHMYVIAGEIARKSGFPFEIFHPLIKETAFKASEQPPELSQTGPAARNDLIIIKKHLDLLSFSPEYKELYRKVTESIMGGAAESGNDPPGG